MVSGIGRAPKLSKLAQKPLQAPNKNQGRLHSLNFAIVTPCSERLGLAWVVESPCQSCTRVGAVGAGTAKVYGRRSRQTSISSQPLRDSCVWDLPKCDWIALKPFERPAPSSPELPPRFLLVRPFCCGGLHLALRELQILRVGLCEDLFSIPHVGPNELVCRPLHLA